MAVKYIVKYFSKSHNKVRYWVNSVEKTPVLGGYALKAKFSYDEKQAYKFPLKEAAEKDVERLQNSGYKGLEIVEVGGHLQLVANNSGSEDVSEQFKELVGGHTFGEMSNHFKIFVEAIAHGFSPFDLLGLSADASLKDLKTTSAKMFGNEWPDVLSTEGNKSSLSVMKEGDQ